MADISKKAGAIGSESQAQQAESQLQALELEIAELRAIQFAMPDPYYVRDMDYNITIWPTAIAELMGFSEAEAKKMKCYDIFKAAVCPPGAQCPTQQCIIDRKFLKDAAVDVYHKSGEAIHTLVSNAGVYDKAGNPIGALEIVKDNTLIKQSVDSISQNIKYIESASVKLHTAIEQVNVASNQVKENYQETIDSIKTGVKAGGSVNEKTGDGTTYAKNVHTGMETINKSMLFSVEKISSLKKNAEAIGKFVSVIQDIASKTNLLAINASIEAAHAGESGRGFKVVADGIRELSKNSSESAQSITGIIREINLAVQESTSSLSVTEDDIASGTKTISELLTFFNEIGTAVTVLLDSLNRIEHAASASSEHVEEQNASVAEMSSIGKDLAAIAQRLTEEVYKMVQYTHMGA